MSPILRCWSCTGTAPAVACESATALANRLLASSNVCECGAVGAALHPSMSWPRRASSCLFRSRVHIEEYESHHYSSGHNRPGHSVNRLQASRKQADMKESELNCHGLQHKLQNTNSSCHCHFEVSEQALVLMEPGSEWDA